MILTVDREKHFIPMPLIARTGMSPAGIIGIVLPEFPTTILHRFIGQGDATFGHQFFNIPVAQAKADIQPDAAADDLRWKPMTLTQVGEGWSVHTASMTHESRAENGKF